MQNLLLYDTAASGFHHSNHSSSNGSTTASPENATTGTSAGGADAAHTWSLWEFATATAATALATIRDSVGGAGAGALSARPAGDDGAHGHGGNVMPVVISSLQRLLNVSHTAESEDLRGQASGVPNHTHSAAPAAAHFTANTTMSASGGGSAGAYHSIAATALATLANVAAAAMTATTTTASAFEFVGGDARNFTTDQASFSDGDGDGVGGSANANISSAVIAGNITETPYVPYDLRPETYIVPVLFAIFFIVGVVGNGTLIVVFLSVRQMRNVPNTYILSLALADMLVIVTTVPLTSTVYTVDTWPWGSFLCTLSEFVKDVSIGVSVFTLTALSADRYFAIVDPLRKFHTHGGGKRATRTTIAIAVCIWILAIICGVPALIGTYVKHIDVNSQKSFSFCYPFPEQWGNEYAKTMVLMHFLVYYAIPLIIIAVFYILIARHLLFDASVPGEVQGALRQIRARRKVAVTVLAFVFIFGICFLPYHVFMLWFYFWPNATKDYNPYWHVLRIVGFCLSFANSCANPVALYFVSGAFRKHFNRYLFCQDGGVRHKKCHQHNDTICMHRDTSMTSTTASKRYYNSRRSQHNKSTVRSRLAETTITMLPNGNHADCTGLNSGRGHAVCTASSNYMDAVHSEGNELDMTTVDYCSLRRDQQQKNPNQPDQQRQQERQAFM